MVELDRNYANLHLMCHFQYLFVHLFLLRKIFLRESGRVLDFIMNFESIFLKFLMLIYGNKSKSDKCFTEGWC